MIKDQKLTTRTRKKLTIRTRKKRVFSQVKSVNEETSPGFEGKQMTQKICKRETLS